MTITATSYKAILSGYNWLGFDVYGKPAILTYSFPKTQPDWQENYVSPSSFRSFSDWEQEVVREALDKFEEVAGLRFLEVKGDGGDIIFSRDGNGSSGTSAHAYHPSAYNQSFYGNYADRSVDIGGDVFFSSVESNSFLPILLHEIGHAVGLKHSFDGDDDRHPEILQGSDDDRRNTMMSYSGGLYDEFGPLDIQALRKIYGGPASEGGGAVKVVWRPASETLFQTGGAKGELIRGINQSDVIKGGGGRDLLYGLDGDDTLAGGAGDDRLWGGDGADVFLFGKGAGRDTVYDFEEGDRLSFNGIRGVDRFSDLDVDQHGYNTVVSWAAGRVTLINVLDLQRSDVIIT